MGKVKSGGKECWVCGEWFWPDKYDSACPHCVEDNDVVEGLTLEILSLFIGRSLEEMWTTMVKRPPLTTEHLSVTLQLLFYQLVC